MKRKRDSTCSRLVDAQTYDLVLIDANGRSIRAHKALLIDKSDYFAKILDDIDVKEIHLNENYLVELINFLYNHELEPTDLAVATQVTEDFCETYDNESQPADQDATILNGDIDILMQILVLSKKYQFKQLYQKILVEINCRLGPNTAITIYKCAQNFQLKALIDAAKIMILSWLPSLQTTEQFLVLPETAINDIYEAEPLEIESETKLNALSAWWSHNKEADMTNLWVQLIDCTYK